MKRIIIVFSIILGISATVVAQPRAAGIRIGATGGSINLAMLPLLIISLRHGPFKGFIGGGIIFGFITCLIDGYGLITYPLEYFLAFGIVGILGFFSHFIHKSMEENKTYIIVPKIIDTVWTVT